MIFCLIGGSLYNLDDIKKVMQTTLGYKDGDGETIWKSRVVIQYKSGGSDSIDGMTLGEFIKTITNSEMRIK